MELREKEPEKEPLEVRHLSNGTRLTIPRRLRF